MISAPSTLTAIEPDISPNDEPPSVVFAPADDKVKVPRLDEPESKKKKPSGYHLLILIFFFIAWKMEMRDESDIVARANALLPRVGQEGFKDLEELKRLACSMFVYLFESLFHKIEETERRPRFKAEYAFNADLVIQALANIVDADLSYISGAEIADVRFSKMLFVTTPQQKID